MATSVAASNQEPSIPGTTEDQTTKVEPQAVEQSLDSWDDPENTRNPANWSMPIRIFNTMFPCFLAFNITFTTSTTIAATSIFKEEFGLSTTVSLLPLTLYTLGLAFGPPFIAPLSESFGRKLIYIGSHLLFMLFLLGAALSPTFAEILVCRFLGGFFGSAGLATGAGTVAEVWQLHKAGGMAALFFILGPFLGPTLGPVAGAYILHYHENNWRWTQYIVLITGAPIMAGLLLMRETHKATILQGRKRTTITQIKQSFKVALVRPIKMLFTEAIVASLAIFTAYAYAVIFSYFAAASYILPLYYDFNPREASLSLVAVVIGYCMASFMFGVFDKTLYKKAASKASNGIPDPEHRLYSGLVGSILIPASLFWYAWEAKPNGHWPSLITAGIPFGLGSFSLFLSAITYQVDVYRAGLAASALAANGMLRYTLGAVFPLFTVQLLQRLGTQWGISLFAFLSLLLLPIPWLLFRYGPRLRMRDRKF